MNRPLESATSIRLPRNYRKDRRFGLVYDQPPASADDLSAIRGVNTREAVILNRLGVYYLGQVAQWGHRQTVAFADELGMSSSTLIDEQWVEQARALCPPPRSCPEVASRHLPASLVRTLSLLACAMLISCLVVYWLSARANQRLTGMLSADITSIRVPVDSKLVVSHVKAGDEVFSGDKLLTLEKTEHLTLISRQRGRVQALQQELNQAEAQAALNLEWRLREVDRDLSEIRSRANLIREVTRNSTESFRSAAIAPATEQLEEVRSVALPVSQSRFYTPVRQTTRSNGLLFIGASGDSTIDATPQRQPLPIRTEPGPPQPEPKVVLASEGSTDRFFGIESRSVQERLARLDELRSILPQQVQRAAGVESIRVQFDDASTLLNEMQTLSRDVAVLCPGYGKVGQVRYRPGDSMSAGEVMLKILHTERRYVMLQVPTRRVNEIEPGTLVELIFPGNGRYNGKVVNLPMLADLSGGGQSHAVVRVEATGRLWPEIPVGSEIDVVLK